MCVCLCAPHVGGSIHTFNIFQTGAECLQGTDVLYLTDNYHLPRDTQECDGQTSLLYPVGHYIGDVVRGDLEKKESEYVLKN